MSGQYRIAQVCLNGHSINSMADKYPEFNKSYCDKCGSKTVTNCPSCSSPIKGKYDGGGIDLRPFLPPAYCESCGKPFPWTTKAQEAAYEVIEFSSQLDNDDKKALKESVNGLMDNGPKTSIAVLKFKSYASKAGKEIAGALKEILIDVVSETVKKSIWG